MCFVYGVRAYIGPTPHARATPRMDGVRALCVRTPLVRALALKKSRPISRVLSWTAIPLAGVSPRRSSDLPGSRAGRTWPLSRPASLFGLAPGGVCRAVVCCHRRGALLPHHFTLAGVPKDAWAVYFLLHFPWAHAPQALPGTVPWEPGLSSTRSSRAAAAWPTPARTIGDSPARLKSDLPVAAEGLCALPA